MALQMGRQMQRERDVILLLAGKTQRILLLFSEIIQRQKDQKHHIPTEPVRPNKQSVEGSGICTVQAFMVCSSAGWGERSKGWGQIQKIRFL